jgi:hypothetical protein
VPQDLDLRTVFHAPYDCGSIGTCRDDLEKRAE